MMFSVTLAARNRLLTKLIRKEADQDLALRFTRRDAGWRLQLDQAHSDDTAFVHEGRSVLLADKAVSAALADATLDVKKTKSGARLTLRKNQIEKES